MPLSFWLTFCGGFSTLASCLFGYLGGPGWIVACFLPIGFALMFFGYLLAEEQSTGDDDVDSDA